MELSSDLCSWTSVLANTKEINTAGVYQERAAYKGIITTKKSQNIKTAKLGAGVMAQQLQAMAALPKDLSSASNIHMAA